MDLSTTLDPADYAIAGQVPRRVLRPASRDELSEMLRAATRDNETVVPWGGGVHLRALGSSRVAPTDARGIERSNEIPPYHVAIDLRGLDRIVEYDPEDLTLTAECGITLAKLAALTASKGQELPLEAPLADRATLGGVLAANASGPRRLRLGSPRDRLLGARFALGDGTIARTGGRVVKNVAGYAIHRMLCGSRGALGILVEASLKLLPLPGSRVALLYHPTDRELAEKKRWASLLHREPAALTAVGPERARDLPAPPPAQRWWVCVGIEEDPAHVANEEAHLRHVLGEPAARLAGDDVTQLWRQLSDLEEASADTITFAGPQGTPADLVYLVANAIAEPATAPAIARVVFHAPAGRLHLDGEGERFAWLLQRAGFRLIRGRGTYVPPRGTDTLRERIRQALDPAGRFALGGRWTRAR